MQKNDIECEVDRNKDEVVLELPLVITSVRSA